MQIYFEGPKVDLKGNLRGGCTQLLRKVDNSSSSIDTYDWTRAATNAKCTNNNDGSKGLMWEM